MIFPQTLWWLVLVSLVPLLSFLMEEKRLRDYLIGVFFFSCTFVSLSTIWFFKAVPLDWAGVPSVSFAYFLVGCVWIIFTAVMALPVLAWGLIIFRVQHKYPVLLVSASFLWILAEYVRSWLVTAAFYGKQTLFGPHHTYYALGYPLAEAPILKNLFPVGGLYLASLFVIMSNFLILTMIFFFLKKKEVSPRLVIRSCISFSVMWLSLFLFVYTGKNTIQQTSLQIVVVNGNVHARSVAEGIKKKQELSNIFLDSFNQKSDLIIFPENFNPFSGLQFSGAYAVIGSYTGEHFYNLFFWDPLSKKGNVSFYQKKLLMPVVEYPLAVVEKIVYFFTPDSWSAGYKSMSTSHKKGSATNVVSFIGKNSSVGVSLCSENISPIMTREAVQGGSEFLVNIASLAPFHGSLILERQTEAVIKARALETGRYFVVSSNGAESFVIDNHGTKIFSLKSNKEISYGKTIIFLENYITPYVRYGDWVVIISVVMMSLQALWFFPFKKEEVRSIQSQQVR